MAAINEAWHVLSDPGRRALYDARTHPAAPRGPTVAARPAVRAPLATPARFPWKGVAVAAVVGSVAVILLSLLRQPVEPPPVDNILTAGSCVVFEDGGFVREVRCDEPYDAVVDRLVPFDASCPSGLEARRDRQGMGLACLQG